MGSVGRGGVGGTSMTMDNSRDENKVVFTFTKGNVGPHAYFMA